MRVSTKITGVFAIIFFLSIIATGCVTAQKNEQGSDGGDTPARIEFEQGIIEGNILVNSQPDNEADGTIEPASGDSLYMTDSGTITVTANVPAAGDYVVKIYYALPTSYGDKENNVMVNDTDLGPQKFPATGGKWTAKWIQATLQEGDNTISISHNWGYTWFDYLTVEALF
ncbi:CBM35 domain-containing protein [Spirochaeta lutea]|uniref:CBM6 domain-containing protein n=1 Tax=Spirochaeta lutea TaxID=1480694 RepID=A0A098QV62_9SPIO|nr:CBM35 domain-containing protein [Spirochaeta lutea]KGE71451.1 hypothetical protein DC28_11785 [Spirochaeta lutea]